MNAPDPENFEAVAEERAMPAIGSVISFYVGGGKKWVIVSRFPHPASGEEIVGLCDGVDFAYHQLSYVLTHARQVSGDNQDLIQSALRRKEIRFLAFQEFDSLRRAGEIPGHITTDRRDVRRTIHRIFRRCAEENDRNGEQEGSTDGYIQLVRAALIRQFREQAEAEPTTPIHERPLLEGKELEFADPLTPLHADIEGRSVELVTIRYIQQLVKGESKRMPGRNSVASWLQKSGVHPVLLRARIKYPKSVAYCDAYDLQQVKDANQSSPFAPEPPEGEQLPQAEEDGSVMLDVPELELGMKYWTLAGFAKKYGLDSGILARVLQKALPEVKPIKAILKNVRKTTGNIWPEWALEEIRMLLVDEQGKMELYGNDESSTVTVSTVGNMVVVGTRQSGAIAHALEQNVQPITIADVCRDLGIAPDAVSVVKKLRIPSEHSMRRIRLEDGTGMLLYTKDNKSSDAQSIIVVQSSETMGDLEPARRISELSEELRRVQNQSSTGE